MIAAKIESVYEVRLPEEIRTFYEAIASIITLGFDLGLELTPLECLNLNGYFWQMVFWTVLPMGLVGCVFAGAAAWLCFRRRFTLGRLLSAAAPITIRILFLAYPIVTKQAFQAFSWFDFTKEGVGYLRADVSVKSGTPEHSAARAIALIAIIVYPVGLIATAWLLLFRAALRHRALRCA